MMEKNQGLIAKETVNREALGLNTNSLFVLNMLSLPEQHIKQGLFADNVRESYLLINMTLPCRMSQFLMHLGLNSTISELWPKFTSNILTPYKQYVNKNI